MLDRPLFARGARGMAPSPAALTLALRIGQALRALDDAAQGLRARGAPPSVAALPRLVNDTMLRALAARAAHPTEAAAAAALGLSQSALHQALRGLEHAARIPLYERTRVGARLNGAGEWLLQHAKVALAEVRIGLQEIASPSGPQVAVGALPMSSDVLVPQAVARALGRQPGMNILVKDGTYESLTRLLREADVDFIVGPLRGAEAASDLVEEALFVDRLVAVVRPGHPLLAGGRAATLRQLARYPWIGSLPGTPADAVFERLCERIGSTRPTVALRAHSAAVVRSVLRAGDHVALLSPLHVQAEVRSGMLAVASAPLRGTERAIGLTQRRGALPSTAAAAVMARVRQVAADTLADTPR